MHFNGYEQSWHSRFAGLCLVSLGACSEPAPPAGPALGRVQSEIVGGVVAAPGEGQYVAALFQDFGGEFGYICGGTFVAEDVVVTAAHCSFGTIELAEQNQLVVGSTDPAVVRVARRPASLGAVDVADLLQVESVFVHPNFDPVSHDNDIAVWKLASGSPGAVLKVASTTLTNRVENLGNKLPTFGYGSTDPDSLENSDVLRRVNVPVIDHSECRSLLYDALGGASQPLLPEQIVTTNMICAGREGKDSCQGDDGGPVSINSFLIGITSWGLGCGVAAQPRVYTRVALFRRWINDCADAECDHLTPTTTCAEGFIDCDGVPANGCETSGNECVPCEGECYCDVLSPNDPAPGYEPCGAGSTCLAEFETETFATSTACAPEGPGGIGDSCLVDGELDRLACGAGLTCEFGECLPWCDLASPACPDGSQCVAAPFPTGRSVIDRELGVCYGGVVYQEDFSECGNEWEEFESVRPLVSAHSFCTSDPEDEGLYSLDIQLDNWAIGIGAYSRSGQSLAIVMSGVAETRVYSSSGEFDSHEQGVGLNCGSVAFLVRLDGFARVFQWTGFQPSRDLVPLTDWIPSAAIATGDAMNHIMVRCIGESPRVYTLLVNGEQVVEYESADRSPPEGVGFAAATFPSSYPWLSAQFDDFFVREASSAELAAWLGDTGGL